MAALLALGGAVCWGAGDFLGGLAARRMAVIAVLAISQAIGLAGLLVWVLATREAFPGIGPLLPAVAAGVAVLIGLAALYRGLAVGAMGIVAPISAASPLVGLTADAAQGTFPAALQWLGIGLVLAGIATLSLESSDGGGGRVASGVGLALVAALGFGLFVVGLDAGSDESAEWAVVAARVVSAGLAVVVALVLTTSLRPSRGAWPLLIGVGIGDTLANVLVAIASTRGAVGIVAVLSATYPIVTVLLARVFLDERLTTPKRVGGVIAIAGAVLVAAG
jgi:drug/metabolite transporter (DMT)-like permease